MSDQPPTRKSDKVLHDLLFRNLPLVQANEKFMSEFYMAVRTQALEDSADYLYRFGTTLNQKTRVEAPKLAKKLRDMFYGAAHEIRTDGRAGDELLAQMLTVMKQPVVMQDAQGNMTVVHPDAFKEPVPDPADMVVAQKPGSTLHITGFEGDE